MIPEKGVGGSPLPFFVKVCKKYPNRNILLYYLFYIYILCFYFTSVILRIWECAAFPNRKLFVCAIVLLTAAVGGI